MVTEYQCLAIVLQEFISRIRLRILYRGTRWGGEESYEYMVRRETSPEQSCCLSSTLDDMPVGRGWLTPASATSFYSGQCYGVPAETDDVWVEMPVGLQSESGSLITGFGTIVAAERRQRRRRGTAEYRGQKVKFEGKGVASISAVGSAEVSRINRPARSGVFVSGAGRV